MSLTLCDNEQISIMQGDLQAFSEFYSDSPAFKDRFLSLVMRGIVVPFYAVNNGKMVGQIYFVKRVIDKEVADGKSTGFICNLHVMSMYRKRGIGSALVNYVKDYAKRNGFKKLSLGVDEIEVDNVRLYKKLGFNEHIKNINIDMLFRDEYLNPIEVAPYSIIACILDE